jgi:hypothetical protein
MSEPQSHDAQAQPLRIVQAPEGLDVSEIMREVRELARSRAAAGGDDYHEPMAAGTPARSGFGAEWVTTVGEQLDLLRAAARLQLEGDPIRSHRPRLGRVIVAWKKFVRYWVRKYTDALFLRQSFFNSQVVGALEQLQQRVDALEDEVAALREALRRQGAGEPRAPENKNRP